MRPPRKAGGNRSVRTIPDFVPRFNEAPAKSGGEWARRTPRNTSSSCFNEAPAKSGGE